MNYQANLCIATYNRISLTKQCIPNIKDTASENIPYLISVIDNGSSDGTPEYLKELFTVGIINNLILLPKNVGISKAHNILWKLFDDIPYYAKIDNDVTFNKKNWLNDILTIYNNCTSIGALGYNVETRNYYSVVTDNGHRYRLKSGNIGGACFFVSNKVKNILGYWNEGFDLYGEEDADYGYRIAVAGLKNCYMEDETVMNHLHEVNKEYSDFKVSQRNDNLKNKWAAFVNSYKNKSNLYIQSNAINEIEFTLMSNVI